MNETVDVVVIGAGIAGLSAAYDLNARATTLRVLDQAATPGGVAQTERLGDWVIDRGPDSFLLQKPAALELCTELGLESQLISTQQPRTAYVLRDGSLHPLAEGSFLGFPLSLKALATSSLFTTAGKARMAAEVFIPRREWRDEDDESIGAFVTRRFGREAADYLAEPLLAGIHAGDVDDLSVRVLFPRLVETERRHGSILRAFRALKPTRSARGAFASLAAGVGSLVEALVARLPQGTLRPGTRATSVQRDNEGRYLVSTTDGSWLAQAVVLAVPAYEAATLVAGLDGQLATACSAIRYASTATVALGYRTEQVPHPLRGTGFVVPRAEGSALLAATWVTSKWPGRAPAGHVLLRAFFGGGRDPDRLDRHDDAGLVALAREEFGAILGATGEPVLDRTTRWLRQSPQYSVGHADRLAAIERRLHLHAGLFGTGSGFGAIGIPDCISHGRRVASHVTSFLHTMGRP